MSGIQFFDANCQIGRHNHRIEGSPYSLDHLLSDSVEHGIVRRLVHHAMAREHSTRLGNGRLLDEIGEHPSLAPCWAISTWTTGEMAKPDTLIAELARARVRAVRFFRNAYRVPPAEWSLGALWSELARHGVPLIFDVGDRWATMDPFDADQVHALCSAHPALPVVLVKHRIRYNRQVYQLLDACPNLRLELSGYWHYRAIEEICQRFGDERLLFGTNWPYMDSSFAVAAVMYAQVSEATRAAVAGGNLHSLLEAVQW